MASHYALFTLGLWMGLNGSRKFWIGKLCLGCAITVLVHTPAIFDISAYDYAVRLLVEVALLCAGFLVGSSLPGNNKVTYSLLGGWMGGDTALSIAFILGDSVYAYPSSPYPVWQIRDTGMFMFILMDVVAFFLIMKIFISYVEKA